MKRLQSLREVLISWRRCMERGMSSRISSPVDYLKNDDLRSRIRENAFKIGLFEENCKSIEGLVTCKHSFLMVDTGGTVLKKNQSKLKKRIYTRGRYGTFRRKQRNQCSGTVN